MTDPFLLDTPAAVQFSGGPTSGYLLYRVIRAFGGTLPDDVAVLFCNTGKEDPATLDFVDRCSREWGVPIVWLEFRSRAMLGFEVVNHATASRNGEPFSALVRTKQYLPNPVQRSCTQWLKILTAHRYCRNVLGWESYDSAVGLRADEPERVASLAPMPDLTPGEEPCAPLHRAGVTKADVEAFWQAQPFRLEADPDFKNCDQCFMKGLPQRVRVERKRPGSLAWWEEQERWVSDKVGRPSTFRKGLSVLNVREMADGKRPVPEESRRTECRCTD